MSLPVAVLTEAELAAFDAAYDHAAGLGQNAELELCEELPRLRATIAAKDAEIARLRAEALRLDAQGADDVGKVHDKLVAATLRIEQLEAALRTFFGYTLSGHADDDPMQRWMKVPVWMLDELIKATKKP